MKSLVTFLALIAGSSFCYASAPEIHSNEELTAYVLNSVKFKEAKQQIGSLELTRIIFENDGLSPVTIYFKYGSGNPAPCEVQATIPVHFINPTSVTVVCNGAKVDPGFSRY